VKRSFGLGSLRQRALEAAPAAEESAVRFYRCLAEATKARRTTRTLQELVAFEQNHSNGWAETLPSGPHCGC